MRLDPDRIFVREGRLWTSAGITAGIDLSLALIGEDLGEAVTRRTAQHLVVYHRRPGGQSQFSALLEMESSCRADHQGGGPRSAPAWQGLELWALLAADKVAVSVEPPGGSPTGSPTGPVIIVANLAALG